MKSPIEKLFRDNFCRESSRLSPLSPCLSSNNPLQHSHNTAQTEAAIKSTKQLPPNSAAATRRKPKIASMRNGDDRFCDHRRCDSKRYFLSCP